MKKIWARIGMEMDVPDSTYEILKEVSAELAGRYPDGEKHYADLVLSEGMIHDFVTKGRCDGDSYIPATVFEDMEKNDG